jgi:hypothetical protein
VVFSVLGKMNFDLESGRTKQSFLEIKANTTGQPKMARMIQPCV